MCGGSTNSEEAVIPVDATGDESDSSYGEDLADSTTSITDSIKNYREFHGRTYQNFKGIDYWGPNDDKQNEQLDIVHHMLTQLLDNKLFLAPIGDNPQKVIDIGTGTGIWAIDFADQFPSAEVIGTDLSDIMPHFVPPNLKFELDDAEMPWTYAPDSFDFVHMRYLIGAVSDWPSVYKEAFKVLKPGGWIEHFEFSIVFESDDGSLGEDNPLSKWAPIQLEAGEKMGKSLGIYETFKRDIIGAGFVDIQERKFKLPVGPWSSDPKMKQIGLWNLMFFLQDTEAFCLVLLSRVMGWPVEEVLAWVKQIKDALKNRKTHTYYRGSVVYGRKPNEPKEDARV